MERITPSKMGGDAWTGTPARVARTHEQIRNLSNYSDLRAKRGRFGWPEDHAVTVEREGVSVTYTCPVVSARKDRTGIQVLAPNGTAQWIAWDGKVL